MKMKIYILLPAIVPIAFRAQPGGFISKVKYKVSQKVNQRVDNKVDKAIDKILDGIEGKNAGNGSSTGNMNRYVWSLDNKVVSEADKILARKGENLRLVLYNGSMMRHPMHLHGHDFRVLNGQGEHAPLKNIIDIMPMETHIGRYIGRMQWFMPFIGFDWRYRKSGHTKVERNIFGQGSTKDNRALLSAGFNYTLPMLVRFQGEVFTDGIARFH